MDRHFVYYVIFIVSLGGTAICAPEANGGRAADAPPDSDENDSANDHFYVSRVRKLYEQPTLIEMWVDLSPEDGGLILYDCKGKKPVSPVPTDSKLLIKYADIKAVDPLYFQVTLLVGWSPVRLLFRNVARARLFADKVRIVCGLPAPEE